MYTTRWSTSPRDYGVTVERDVKIRMADGTHLDAEVHRPSAPGRFPVILGISPYPHHTQSSSIRPVGFTGIRANQESGDPTYFVRRGYVHAVVNLRGTGNSEGFFQFTGPVDVQDTASVIEWLAEQPWSNGNVGTFGVSYFAKMAKAVGAVAPAPLKTIFAPYSANDWYRGIWYHGGILNARFLWHWRHSPYKLKFKSLVREQQGEEAWKEGLARIRDDEELWMTPGVQEAVANPDYPPNQLYLDLLMNPLDGPFWQERNVDEEPGEIPAFLGACWGNYGVHLEGVWRAHDAWKGPKKLVIGPPVYLDRPLYQLQMEALRWFDQFLKGNDCGVLDDPAIRCFMMGAGNYETPAEWPPEEARWTTFYLHDRGTLSEHEPWPGETVDTLDESPFEHGQLTYVTPPIVEPTDVLGPLVLTLYLECTGTEALVFVTLLHVDSEGTETELTRGWLRASQREVAPHSPPWAPYQLHTTRELLEPGEIYELKIPIVPTARHFAAGERLAVRIKGSDLEPPRTSLEGLAHEHLRLPRPHRMIIHRSVEHPSHLDVPIIRGNLMGTFFSGGDLSVFEYRA